MSGITASMVGLGNVANTAPSDLPVSTATISMIAGVNGSLSASIGSLGQTKADLSNPTFPLNVNIWGNLNVSGTTNFYNNNVLIQGLN